jgi:hypothetical protein
MKLMNSYIKFSISILFTIALSTGFLSIAYVQRAHAFSIDFSGLPGFVGDNQGVNFSQGPKGDTGPQGPAGAPCPHQSKLASITGDGRASVLVLNPTPGENPDVVCVP